MSGLWASHPTLARTLPVPPSGANLSSSAGTTPGLATTCTRHHPSGTSCQQQPWARGTAECSAEVPPKI